VKARGYAMDNEEAYLGSRCFAAPIFEQGGKVVAAISVSGPTSRVTREKVPLFAGAVTLAARTISRHLGYSQPQPMMPGAISQTKPRVAAPTGVS